MTYLKKLKTLDNYRANGVHAERICSEMTYLDGISKTQGGKFDGLIEQAADLLLADINENGEVFICLSK